MQIISDKIGILFKQKASLKKFKIKIEIKRHLIRR